MRTIARESYFEIRTYPRNGAVLAYPYVSSQRSRTCKFVRTLAWESYFQIRTYPRNGVVLANPYVTSQGSKTNELSMRTCRFTNGLAKVYLHILDIYVCSIHTIIYITNVVIDSLNHSHEESGEHTQ